MQLHAVIGSTAQAETTSGTAALICKSDVVGVSCSRQQTPADHMRAFSLEELEAVLATHYALPAASREDMSADGAAAIMARESSERVAERVRQ